MNEIETILCNLFQCERSRLYLDRPRALLTNTQMSRLEGILKKRASGEPLQYLLGDVEFMGLRLLIGPGVLIPRPETEILAEEVIKHISSFRGTPCRVLDIGTGSGNIAISLAKALDTAEITAVDILPLCLDLARSNARLNAVQDRIKFLRSDIFSSFKGKTIKFDFIVSNPPYIASDQFEHLPEDVKQEPRLALQADEDGFYFYSRIEEGSRAHLACGGTLFLEIGAGQSCGIRNIFNDPTFWKEAQFIKDYNGIERVAVIRSHSHG